MQPLLSAVCVTGKTPWHVEYMLPQAIRCFLDQTYPQRELVLVTEQPHLDVPVSDLEGLEEWYEKDLVRVIYAPEAKTLGDLRNAGLDAARGECVIQWDDDDWHASARMTIQMQVYFQQPTLPNAFIRQLAYSFLSDSACVRELPNTFIHGTILHAKKPGLRYPSKRAGEDTDFIGQFSEFAVINNDPGLYLRFSHGHNTWNDQHIMRGTQSGHWALGVEHTCLLREVLKRYPLGQAMMT